MGWSEPASRCAAASVAWQSTVVLSDELRPQWGPRVDRLMAAGPSSCPTSREITGLARKRPPVSIDRPCNRSSFQARIMASLRLDKVIPTQGLREVMRN